MSQPDYDQLESVPKHRQMLRKEEFILAVTCGIAAELARQGVSDADLAQLIGRTRGYVGKVLKGGSTLTLASIADVADALGCRIEVKLAPHGRPARVKPPTARGRRRRARS